MDARIELSRDQWKTIERAWDSRDSARGWSLSELSRQAKVSRPTLAAALQGKSLRPGTAWKIGRALSDGNVPTELPSLVKAG